MMAPNVAGKDPLVIKAIKWSEQSRIVSHETVKLHELSDDHDSALVESGYECAYRDCVIYLCGLIKVAPKDVLGGENDAD